MKILAVSWQEIEALLLLAILTRLKNFLGWVESRHVGRLNRKSHLIVDYTVLLRDHMAEVDHD